MWIVPCLVLVSCQTLPDPIPYTLPATASSLFGACGESDGSVQLEVQRGPESKTQAIDWLGKGRKGWIAEAYNPLGQTMLRLEWAPEKAGGIRIKGAVAGQLPPVRVDDNGFLTVDGYFAGLRPEEIPCLLKFRLPSAWLQRVVRKRESVGKIVLDIREEHRRMEVTIVGENTLKKRRVCALLEWSRWLGMSGSAVRICMHQEDPAWAEVQGLGEYQVKWRDLDGQEEGQ